jgi:hypothetical protein
MVTVAFLSGKMRILAILPRRASAAGLRRSSLQHLAIPLFAQACYARILRQNKHVITWGSHDRLRRKGAPGHWIFAGDLHRHGTCAESSPNSRGIGSHGGSFSLGWPAARRPQ